MPIKYLYQYLQSQVSIAPLAVFRLVFGLIACIGTVRFIMLGWIHDVYLNPPFHFSYYGFEWVQVLSPVAMYIVFTVMAVSAFMVAIGLWYRLAIITYFCTFTYVELIEKASYLNHYYLMSLLAFLLIWVPANRYFSLDVWLKNVRSQTHVSRWCIAIFMAQLSIVYFYAGLAKLNYDWMVLAQPMRIWLKANNHLPIIGTFFNYNWVYYAFSWAGAAYDIFIAFFLWYTPTRFWAYMAVLGFHLMTAALFPIGMFPYIMIGCTLVFFSAKVHTKIIAYISYSLQTITFWTMACGACIIYAWYFSPMLTSRGVGLIVTITIILYVLALTVWLPRNKTHLTLPIAATSPVPVTKNTSFRNTALYGLLTCYFLVQILLPWRYLLYPGHLFWTEEGYRWGWRVMLMEKAAYCTLHVKDEKSKQQGEVLNSQYLSKTQEKVMSAQPDMILQYVHYLEKVYRAQGMHNPQIYAECYVTLNGRPSRLLIDPTIDLSEKKAGFAHKTWILPFE